MFQDLPPCCCHLKCGKVGGTGSNLMSGSTRKEWQKEVTDETQNGRKSKGSLITYLASGVSALFPKH